MRRTQHTRLPDVRPVKIGVALVIGNFLHLRKIGKRGSGAVGCVYLHAVALCKVVHDRRSGLVRSADDNGVFCRYLICKKSVQCGYRSKAAQAEKGECGKKSRKSESASAGGTNPP